jgi:hypothetical protein
LETLPLRFKFLLVAVGAVAIASVAICFALFEPTNYSLAAAAFILAAAMFSEGFPVRLPRGGGEATITFPVIFSAILLFGPALASAIDGTSMLLVNLFTKRREPGRWLVPMVLYNAFQCAICSAWAGVLYRWASGHGLFWTILGVIGAAALYHSVNALLVALCIGFVAGESWWFVLAKSQIGSFLARTVAFAPFGVALYWVYSLVPARWAVRPGLFIGGVVLLLILGVVVARQALEYYARRLASYREAISALWRVIGACSPYTGRHLERVAEYTDKIAAKMGYDAETRLALQDAARLHDIGKHLVGEDILEKTDSLSAEEWQRIRLHPVRGAEFVSNMRYFERIVPWIRYHHERPDGAGYPEGLSDGRIPVEASIIAVADAYDAMTGGPLPDDNRPYTRRLTKDEAINELQVGAGSQFDGDVVAAMVRVLMTECTEGSR